MKLHGNGFQGCSFLRYNCRPNLVSTAFDKNSASMIFCWVATVGNINAPHGSSNFFWYAKDHNQSKDPGVVHTCPRRTLFLAMRNFHSQAWCHQGRHKISHLIIAFLCQDAEIPLHLYFGGTMPPKLFLVHLKNTNTASTPRRWVRYLPWSIPLHTTSILTLQQLG